jgi:hypothetical protein
MAGAEHLGAGRRAQQDGPHVRLVELVQRGNHLLDQRVTQDVAPTLVVQGDGGDGIGSLGQDLRHRLAFVAARRGDRAWRNADHPTAGLSPHLVRKERHQNLPFPYGNEFAATPRSIPAQNSNAFANSRLSLTSSGQT